MLLDHSLTQCINLNWETHVSRSRPIPVMSRPVLKCNRSKQNNPSNPALCNDLNILWSHVISICCYLNSSLNFSQFSRIIFVSGLRSFADSLLVNDTKKSLHVWCHWQFIQVMSRLSKNTSNQINFVAPVTQLIIEHSRRLETSLMCSNFNKYSFNCPIPLICHFYYTGKSFGE